MFNLEQAIADWRQKLVGSGISSSEALDELEDHLRELIEREVQAGVAEDRAFRTAAARIGAVGLLGTEFSKLNIAKDRRGLPIATYLIVAGCLLLINTWTFLEYELGTWERISGLSAVTLVCLYLVRLPHWLLTLSDSALRRLAQVLKLASSFLWLWPLWGLLQAWNFLHSGMGIVPTMVLWCVYAAIALTSFEFAYQRRHRSPPAPGHPPDQRFQRCRSIIFATASRADSSTVDDSVRQACTAARAEARRLGHDYIGTEHLLLGLLKFVKDSCGSFLQKLDLDSDAVRAEIEQVVSTGSKADTLAHLVFTPRAIRAIQLATREATASNGPAIGVEHLFLGLLLERRGVAGVILRKLGIRPKRARELLFEHRAGNS